MSALCLAYRWLPSPCVLIWQGKGEGEKGRGREGDGGDRERESERQHVLSDASHKDTISVG